MRIVLVVILFLFCGAYYSYATHNRAGEITYRQISQYTFEITVITYTATGPMWTADRPELEVFWGDNTSSVLPRVEEVYLPDYYKRNKYIGTHTYPGPGVYVIVVEDPNRNLGIDNIPNSVNTVFSISTTMIINPQIGFNNTPILTQPPVDKAAVGQRFVHNPGAYDPDGDSLSYKLTVCRADNGEPIVGYTFPEASNEFYVDEITGDLVWDAPIRVGVFNVAMLIEEWRFGMKIGEIIRDMQIEVYDTDNRPPVVHADDVLCVLAGTHIKYWVSATDPDGDNITLTANGAPFVMPDAITVFDSVTTSPGFAQGQFRWLTTCADVRRQPYVVNIKAQDDASPVSLVDIKSIYIYVVGPKIENLTAEPTTTSIMLDWDLYSCSEITGYNIYRRISPTGFVPDTCEVGVPNELGYTLIDFVEGRENYWYLDNNKGAGLPQGHEYCYLVTAVFPDGVEGYASDEVCAKLVRGIPTITNVSVLATDSQNGEIYVAWSKPTEYDSIAAPGPYQYVLYRSESYWGENPQEIAVFDNINDTIFYDSLLNTLENPYSYKVEFYNNESGNRFLIGTPHIASSVFITFEQYENALLVSFNKNVPWVNNEYIVYRKNPLSSDFDSIATVSDKFYFDDNLINDEEYCYYVKTIGSYSIEGIVDPIINFSQENCEITIDTVPPCPPVLSGYSECDSLYNHLIWIYPDTCKNDVKYYNVYYTPVLDGDYELVGTTTVNENIFLHYPDFSIAGCYYITAVDSFNNQSLRSNVICLDDCSYYELPNVFTPNDDGIDDFFRPGPYYFVEKVDMKIYNRWGQLVFETTDPDINWDGRNYRNNKPVTTGVYFYLCDVYERRLTGLEVRHLHGFIHVFTGDNVNQVAE